MGRGRGVLTTSPRARRLTAVALALAVCAPAVLVGWSGGAAALAVALSRTPRSRALAALLALASTALGLLAVGAPLLRALVTASAVVAGAAVVVVATEALVRRRALRAAAPGTGAPTERWLFVDLGLGVVAGGAACLLLGGALAALAGLPAPVWAAWAWAVGASASAYTALVLRALARRGSLPASPGVGALERAGVWVLFVLAFAGHAVVPGAVPLALSALAGVLWASLRLSGRAVALQLAATCAAVVALGRAGLGPTPFSALLAQTHAFPASTRTVEDLVVLTGGQASLAELATVVLVVTAVRGALLTEQARADDALELARQHGQVLAGVLEGATEQALVGTTPDLRVSMFSRGAERMLGWTAEEVLGRSPLDLWFPHSGRDDEDWAEVHRTAEAGRSGVFTKRAVCKDGRTLDVVLSFAAQVSATGEVEGHVSVLTDVTAVRAAESALASSEQVFRQAFETAPTGLLMISLAPGQEGRVLRVNRSFAAFTGRSEAELLQLRVRDLLDPRDVDAHLTYLVRAAGGGEPEPLGVERRFTTPSGEVRHARKSTSVIRPDGGQPFLLAVIEDTTAQRAAEEALVRLAMHDPLTDLPNRALLADRLERALTADVRQRVGVTVIYIDLDGFKPVNDSHGHAAGDLLLRAVAERLSGAVRAGDTVARLGGDEFAVLCPGLGADQVPVVLGRMARAVAPPVRLPGGAVVRVGLSTGTATAVGGGDPARLLDEADQAMFANKRRRRADRAAAREDAERLAERIDERMAERAAERGALRAAGAATATRPAGATATWAAAPRAAVPSPAPSGDDGLPSRAVADSSR